MIYLFINSKKQWRLRKKGVLYNLKTALPLYCLGVFLLCTLHLVGCTSPGDNRDIPQIRLTIQNTLPIQRDNVPIVLSLAELKQIASDFSFDAYLVVSGQPPREIPSQVDDTNYDGQKDQLAFLVDLESHETKEIAIRYSSNNQMAITLGFARRTRAGVFPELGGFAALESEFIAYRFQPDGSIRAYGKRTKGLFIDRYVHQLTAPSDAPSAIMTPLTTADGLIGEGGFMVWDTDSQRRIPFDGQREYVRVLADGPVRSIVQRIIPDLVLQSPVTISLTSTFSIYAGHRSGEHRIEAQGLGDQYRIAIGIPSRGVAPVKNEEEGWLWTWDEQGTASAQVGFGVIYPVAQFDSFQDSVAPDSKAGYTVLMTPDKHGEIVYRFSSVWGEGEVGIQTKEEFEQYVQATATKIQTPPIIRFLPQTPGK